MAAAGSYAAGTNREQMVQRTLWRCGCVPRWTGRAPAAGGARGAPPGSGGCAVSMPSSRTSPARRRPARRIRRRFRPASTCTRGRNWRRWWPATRRASRPVCGRPSSRWARPPGSSRWWRRRRPRCCTGRRRLPARRAPPASSSTAASRGAGAG